MPAQIERFYAVKGGTDNSVQMFPEAASQTFKAGDLVTLSSGSVAALATADGAITSSNNTVLGVALADATGVTSTQIPVKVVDDETLVLLPVYHATAASAIPNNATVGASYQLRRQDAKYAIAIDQTSNPVAIVADKIPGNGAEQYGAVWVKILASRRSLG